jgi:TPR repeat protein
VEKQLTDLMYESLKAFEEGDYKTSFELFSKACDLSGDIEECYKLSVAMYNERNYPKRNLREFK